MDGFSKRCQGNNEEKKGMERNVSANLLNVIARNEVTKQSTSPLPLSYEERGLRGEVASLCSQ